jgi:phosphatidylglycerol:prolipoprotein diacylglycerol transferase
MHPIFLQIGGFSIRWYGVLITLGILIGVVIAQRFARRRGLNVQLLGDMIFWCVIWGLVAARATYVITSYHQFIGASFFQMIDIRAGGISIQGGLLGGILVLLYYQRRYKINLYRYADLMAPGVALGIIGGRIGNFFNGSDTVGRLTDWPIGFTWPKPGTPILGIFRSASNWTGFPGICTNNGHGQMVLAGGYCAGKVLRGPVHLTDAYGVLIGVILLIASYYWLRSRRPGWVFWQFLLWYSILRSLVEEPFRLNPLWWPVYLSQGLHKPGIGFFTAAQLASIPVIILSAYMLYRIRRTEPDPEPQPVSNSAPQKRHGNA